MAQIFCRHFTGYKPCGLNAVCDEKCPSFSRPSLHVLIVHLEALGAVLRASSLLPAVHRKFPGCHVTWVTKAPAHLFFSHQKLVDRVVTTSHEDLQRLRAYHFDVGYVLDKSDLAASILDSVQVDIKYGFDFDGSAHAVVPHNSEAQDLWALGLDNQSKFFENKKPETQLLCEALDLPYTREEYQITLTDEERACVARRHRQWGGLNKTVVGVNTGCSPTIPYKKWSFTGLVDVVNKLSNHPQWQVVLLGGPEDRSRNHRVAGLFSGVINSPTERGLRDGLLSVAACDIVVTGDSLGMHMAIALRKWVVAWFGPTCAHEIDLFGRGQAILTSAKCSPCWRRVCHKPTMCYDQLDFNAVYDAVLKGEAWHKDQLSSFKPPSSEICF